MTTVTIVLVEHHPGLLPDHYPPEHVLSFLWEKVLQLRDIQHVFGVKLIYQSAEDLPELPVVHELSQELRQLHPLDVGSVRLGVTVLDMSCDWPDNLAWAKLLAGVDVTGGLCEGPAWVSYNMTKTELRTPIDLAILPGASSRTAGGLLGPLPKAGTPLLLPG